MNEKHNEIDKQILKTILDNPHKLGHLVNKTKLTKLHSYWIKYCFYPLSYFEQNNNLEDMLNFFNSLGKTIDLLNNNQIERQYLTKEILYNLLKEKKRSLQGHRGSYKSTAITIIGTIIRLLFMPDERIAIVRKDFTKASKILKTISSLMKTNEIKEIFKIAHGFYPIAIIDRENLITYNFKTTVTPEGNINAFGVHQDMTGSHYDFIICDDFITLEDKIYRNEREKTKLHIEEITNNILDPDKYIVYTGTPWKVDDAWIICPKPLVFDCYTTGLMTQDEINKKRKLTTNITFLANYELRHGSNKDSIFKDILFDKWQFTGTGIGHIDKKFFGTDTNALTFVEKKKDNRYCVVGFTFSDNIKDKIEFIYEQWKKYRIGVIYTEDNDDKGFTADLLRKKGIPVITYHENMNKHVKIQTHLLENGFWDLIDFDNDTDPEYLSQILDYTQGAEPDDCPDSLACLGRVLLSSSENVFKNRWKEM